MRLQVFLLLIAMYAPPLRVLDCTLQLFMEIAILQELFRRSRYNFRSTYNFHIFLCTKTVYLQQVTTAISSTFNKSVGPTSNSSSLKRLLKNYICSQLPDLISISLFFCLPSILKIGRNIPEEFYLDYSNYWPFAFLSNTENIVNS